MFKETYCTYKDDIYVKFYLPVRGDSATPDFRDHKKQINFEKSVFDFNLSLFSYTAEEKNKGTS
jgi:hypothetical protein